MSCVCIADTREMCECLKDYLCQANIYRKQGNEVTNDIVPGTCGTSGNIA